MLLRIKVKKLLLKKMLFKEMLFEKMLFEVKKLLFKVNVNKIVYC